MEMVFHMATRAAWTRRFPFAGSPSLSCTPLTVTVRMTGGKPASDKRGGTAAIEDLADAPGKGTDANGEVAGKTVDPLLDFSVSSLAAATPCSASRFAPSVVDCHTSFADRRIPSFRSAVACSTFGGPVCSITGSGSTLRV